MSESENAKLIAEANATYKRSPGWGMHVRPGSPTAIMKQLADALEAADERNAELEAIARANHGLYKSAETDLADVSKRITQLEAEHDRVIAEKAWDACLDEIEQFEINTEQAREGNPHRKETPSD